MSTSAKQRPPTKRQQEILDFVREKIVNRGYGPTIREIGTHFGISSPNGVMCHLKALEKKGLISRESNMSRAIRLCDGSSPKLKVPFKGTAVSGSPFRAAVTSDENIEFGDVFAGGDRSTLQVEGTAFVPLGIAAGDFLIIGRHSHRNPASLLVALDDRQHVTIYRVPEGGGAPVPAIPGALKSPKLRILGVLAGVVRKLETAPTVDSASNGVALNGDLH